MGDKISREASEQELNELLDFRDVSQKDREAKSDEYDLIIEGITKGTVVINEDKTVVQTLKYPIGKEDEKIERLVYKARLNVETFQIVSQGIKAADFIGLGCAQISALTGISRNIIKKMDWKDFKISAAIGGFF